MALSRSSPGLGIRIVGEVNRENLGPCVPLTLSCVKS